MASPLTDQLSPKVRFKWSEVCKSVFEQTKSLLVAALVLSTPRYDMAFRLAVDASDTSVGVIQEDSDVVEHPVSYFSEKLNFHDQKKKHWRMLLPWSILKFISAPLMFR